MAPWKHCLCLWVYLQSIVGVDAAGNVMQWLREPAVAAAATLTGLHRNVKNEVNDAPAPSNTLEVSCWAGFSQVTFNSKVVKQGMGRRRTP